jgi:hypothetical protein
MAEPNCLFAFCERRNFVNPSRKSLSFLEAERSLSSNNEGDVKRMFRLKILKRFNLKNIEKKAG